jgi:hypothetical protein
MTPLMSEHCLPSVLWRIPRQATLIMLIAQPILIGQDDDLFRQELKPEVRANFQGMIEAGSVYQTGTKLSSPDGNSSAAVPLSSHSRLGPIVWPARDNMSCVPFYRRHLNPEESCCKSCGALSCRSYNGDPAGVSDVGLISNG